MRTPLRHVALAALLLVVGPSAFAKEAPTVPKGAAVTIPTADKQKVSGTHWESATKGPAVILLADEGEPSSLLPLLEPCLARRLAVLWILPRKGPGASEDVLAAARWLQNAVKTKPARRVGVLAVGARAAVALATAQKTPDALSAAACLGPRKQEGLDAVEASKGLSPDLPVLLVAAKVEAEELERLFAALADARKAGTGAPRLEKRLLEPPPVLEGEPAVLGAGVDSFGKVPLLEAYLAGFLARELGAVPDEVLLDGVLTVEGAEGGAWTKAQALDTNLEGGKAWAYRIDRRVVLGGWMPKGIKMLHLKLKAAHPKLDWSEITGSPIAPANIAHQFLEVMIEAPSGKVRLNAGPVTTTGGGGGKPPALPPGMPPGMPPMPSMPSASDLDQSNPFRLAFAPHGEGWSFEGEVVAENLAKVKNPLIEVAWGWIEGMPPMPRISMRPWMDMNLEGPWTEVPAR